MLRKLLVRLAPGLVIVSLGLLVGVAHAALASPRYAARSYVVVTARDAAAAPAARSFAQTYARLVRQPEIAGVAAIRNGVSLADVLRDVQATSSPDAAVVEVTAFGDSARAAADMANAVAAGLVSFGAAHAQVTGMEVTALSPAFPPSSPVSPDAAVSVAAGLALGVVLTAVVTLNRRRLEALLGAAWTVRRRRAGRSAPTVDHDEGSVSLGPDWVVQVLRDRGAFAGLAPEWRALYDRCTTATPFQSYGWVSSWWTHYGRTGGGLLVLVRHQGRLVGAGAFALRSVLGLRVLTCAGTGVSDYTDVLFDDDCADAAAAHLSRAIAREAAVLDFAEVRHSAAVWSVAGMWSGPSWSTIGSTCSELAAKDLADLAGTLDRGHAKQLRKRLRRIEELGFVGRTVDAHEVGNAVEVMLDQHRRQWAGRGVTPEHTRPRFAGHLRDAFTDMVAHGDGAVVECSRAGEVVAVAVYEVGKEHVGGYLYGYEPDLRGQISVSTLLMRENLRLTVARGRAVYSLLRGVERQKEFWEPRYHPNTRLVLGTGVRARVYARAVLTRSWARRTAKAIRGRWS